MKINFTKMHGTGNDYIYINCLGGLNFDPVDLAIQMCERHFSVGADGIILLLNSDVADVAMRIFNADGSEAEMCGNGIRCLAAFAMDQGAVSSTSDVVSVETLSGVRNARFKRNESGVLVSVSVDIGKPVLMTDKICCYGNVITLSGVNYKFYPISVGNPHCVLIADTLSGKDISLLHRQVDDMHIFPDGVNLEVAEITSMNQISMIVYERGSGITLSCGTGACASVVASVLSGACSFDKEVKVDLPGGTLTCVYYRDGSLVLDGPVETVYFGIYDYIPNGC